MRRAWQHLLRPSVPLAPQEGPRVRGGGGGGVQMDGGLGLLEGLGLDGLQGSFRLSHLMPPTSFVENETFQGRGFQLPRWSHRSLELSRWAPFLPPWPHC